MTTFAIREHKLLVRQDGGNIVLPTRAELEAVGVDVSTAHDSGCGASAIAIGDVAVPSFEFRSVRSQYMVLSPDQFALAGKALHVLHWVETSRLCGRCGAATELEPGERVTKCHHRRVSAHRPLRSLAPRRLRPAV